MLLATETTFGWEDGHYPSSPDEGYAIDIGLPQDGMFIVTVLVGLLTLAFA